MTLPIQAEPGNAQLYLMRGELHRLHRDWAAARAEYAAASQALAALPSAQRNTKAMDELAAQIQAALVR